MHRRRSKFTRNGQLTQCPLEAARIAALAGPDEVLASRDAAEAAGISHGGVRNVELKGISRPVDVVTVSWR